MHGNSKSRHNASRRLKTGSRESRIRQEMQRGNFDALASYVPSRAMKTAW